MALTHTPVEQALIDITRIEDESERLASLTHLHTVRLYAEYRIERGVTEARREGKSWSEIGDALGVSKQAAQQRYSATEARGLQVHS